MTYRLFLVSCLVSLSTHPQDLLARGQGTPLFGLHENVPLNRVWFVGNQEPEMNEFCLKECQGHARTLTLTLDCPPPRFLATSRVLHATFSCLFVFFCFQINGKKILFLTQSILFPFDPKCQKKLDQRQIPRAQRADRSCSTLSLDLLFLLPDAVASLLTFKSHSPLNHRFDKKINCPYSHAILWRLLECNAAPTEVEGNTVNFVLVAKLQIKTTFIASILVRLGQW